MDKHTFKVRDLVTCHDITCLCPDGTKAVVVELKNDYLDNQIWISPLDESFRDVNGYFYEKDVHDYLKHDAEFQVGDWVRYEGIHPRVVSPLLEGKIGQIDYLSGDSCAGISQFHMQSSGIVYKENLVKIQPPQEESDNTIVHVFTSYTNKEEKMVIQEIESNNRRVHNVRECVVDGVRGWRRDDDNRVIFYPSTHWEPVEEWVKIEVRKSQWDSVNKCCNMLEVQKKSEDYPDTCTLSWRYPQ